MLMVLGQQQVGLICGEQSFVKNEDLTPLFYLRPAPVMAIAAN
jgi:hypothetical protein